MLDAIEFCFVVFCFSRLLVGDILSSYLCNFLYLFLSSVFLYLIGHSYLVQLMFYALLLFFQILDSIQVDIRNFHVLYTDMQNDMVCLCCTYSLSNYSGLACCF